MCGLCVCLQCYDDACASFDWPSCGKTKHELTKMVMAQRIPNNYFHTLTKAMHNIRAKLAIPQKCKCQLLLLNENIIETNNEPNNEVHDNDDDDKVLRIVGPENQIAFKDQWKRGKPVVMKVSGKFQKNLWKPKTFANQFGSEINQFEDFITGYRLKMKGKTFWNGFQCLKKRRKKNENTLLLKLKDWPEDNDIRDVSKQHYDDFFLKLPMSDYTRANSIFNLVKYLPETFVKPELGPKLFSAYGSVLYPKIGTTKLHIDSSDAVNILVHASLPKDTDTVVNVNFKKEIYDATVKAGCDLSTCERVKKGELPGAIWHIYKASDAISIRRLYNKIQNEKGVAIDPKTDPIHDQRWYLDSALRRRLFLEYNVVGYTIAQFEEDVIFIPAGSAHQVWNIQDCIKMAEDFVSPEHLKECIKLTNEFRYLYKSHSNNEDKLQIKSILYHTIRIVVSELTEKGSKTYL